jgi:hypothetical protein
MRCLGLLRPSPLLTRGTWLAVRDTSHNLMCCSYLLSGSGWLLLRWRDSRGLATGQRGAINRTPGGAFCLEELVSKYAPPGIGVILFGVGVSFSHRSMNLLSSDKFNQAASTGTLRASARSPMARCCFSYPAALVVVVFAGLTNRKSDLTAPLVLSVVFGHWWLAACPINFTGAAGSCFPLAVLCYLLSPYKEQVLHCSLSVPCRIASTIYSRKCTCNKSGISA